MAKDIVKQSANSPLFPDIEWEAPMNKIQRGELLIVGGSPHGFASVANAFEYTKKAGIGEARVLMPEATKTAISGFIDNVSFLPSTISGSFSKKGMTALKDHAKDAWATLLAGEFGRNSETSALIEGFLMSNPGKIILNKDAVDYAITSYPKQILARKDTLIVASLSQLQKLLQRAGMQNNVQFIMGIEQLATFLCRLSQEIEAYIITVHHDHVFVVVDGRVSITPLDFEQQLWQTKIAAFTSVYWIQHPTKVFEGITTATYESIKNI